MHVADGLLPAQVCAGGYALTGLTTWLCLRQIQRQPDPNRGMAKAALLTAAFFVASSLRVPVPPASIHPVLNGFMGALLGPFAFPAVLVGLLFQAVMFGHGGLTTLGLNALIMGWPALAAWGLFRYRGWAIALLGDRAGTIAVGFLAGAAGVGLAVSAFFAVTISTIPADVDRALEQQAIVGLWLAHLPLMAIEGAFTAAAIAFLQRVQPELLVPAAAPFRRSTDPASDSI